MGKRRRPHDAARRKGKKAGEGKQQRHNVVAARPARSNPSQDMDVDCVTYHSGSEEEIPQNVSDQRVDERDLESEEDSDSEPEIAIGDTVDDESEVELSIEFFDPTPADVLPVQNFLKKYEHRIPTQKTNLSVRKMAEAICSQTRVGTTIRVTDDDTPIGFISCLNMRDHKLLLKPILRHILRLCEGNNELEKLSKVLKSTSEGIGKFERERMGLILCERVLNFPPLLVPKLLESLFLEIEWAVEDEPTEKERESFRFGWYLYITEVYYVREAENGAAISKGDEKEVKKKRKKENCEAQEMSFARVEDEAWHKYALATVTWNVASDTTDRTGIKRTQMAMLINSRKVDAVRRMISGLIGIKDNDDNDKQGIAQSFEAGE